MTKASLLISVLLLGACGSETVADSNGAEANLAIETPASDNNTAAEAAPAAAAAPATAEVGGPPTADFMVGKWSAMDEDCSDTIEFRKDGTTETPIGPGKWTLVGDKLTFDYGDGSKQPPSAITVLSQDRIEIVRGSGGKETAKRC